MPFMLPRFEPNSVESLVASKLDAQLKVRLACLQMEKEERDRDFQLHRELEFKRLEAKIP